MMSSSNIPKQNSKQDNSTEIILLQASSPVDTSLINKFNVINLLAFVANTFVTFAIGTGGLFGRPTNSELSAKYQTIVTPIGLAFSIWGIIFIAQGIWAVLQIVMPNQRNSQGVYKVGWLYGLVSLAQCSWTLSFSYEVMWLSLISMYAICACLVLAVLRLQTWKGKTIGEYFLWQFPLSLHCGWIIAASAVNTNVLPVFYEATANAQIGIASTSLGILILVAGAWLIPYPVDLAIPSVLVWALWGVYQALEDPVGSIVTTFSQSQIKGIQYASLSGLCLIALGIVVKIAYVLVVQRPTRLAAAAMEDEHSPETSSNDDDAATDEENPTEYVA